MNTLKILGKGVKWASDNSTKAPEPQKSVAVDEVEEIRTFGGYLTVVSTTVTYGFKNAE